LNLIAQGLLSWRAAVAWFSGLSCPQKAAVLRELAHITAEAHPLATELDHAIAIAGPDLSYRPCRVLRGNHAPESCFELLLCLPENEWGTSFRLLLGLFYVADTRRRVTQCYGGCTHEWHQLRRAG